ncbi:MAG: hypothetical protein ACXU93_08960 [Thermodesulfobacteriota bacterium]
MIMKGMILCRDIGIIQRGGMVRTAAVNVKDYSLRNDPFLLLCGEKRIAPPTFYHLSVAHAITSK